MEKATGKATENDLIIGPLETMECPICKDRVQGMTMVWAGDAQVAFTGCQKCFDEEASKSPLTQALCKIVQSRDKRIVELIQEIDQCKEKTKSLLDLIDRTKIDEIRKILQIAIDLPDPWADRALESNGRLCELREMATDLRKELLE